MQTETKLQQAAATLNELESRHLSAFEALAIEPGEFDHRAHVYVAWLYLRRARAGEMSIEAVVETVSERLSSFARGLGLARKFHQTITTALVLLIGAGLERESGTDFDRFCAANPELLGDFRALLQRHYSDALLQGDAARERFVPPDRQALPDWPLVAPAPLEQAACSR